MEKVFTAKTWNFFTWFIIFTGAVFIFSDILVWVQTGWQNAIKVLLIEGLLMSVLLLILLLGLSRQVVLTEQGITQTYWSPLLLKAPKSLFRTHDCVEWKDITRIEGEFGFLHIREKITLYLSRNKFSTWDIIQELDRITITNDLMNFEYLVVEIVKKASSAAVNENVKKFVSRHENAES